MLEELLEHALETKQRIRSRLKESPSDKERAELEEALKETLRQEKELRANL